MHLNVFLSSLTLITLGFLLRGAGIGWLIFAGRKIVECLVSICFIISSSDFSSWLHSGQWYLFLQGSGTGWLIFAGLQMVACLVSICFTISSSVFASWLHSVQWYRITSGGSLWNVLVWMFSSILWLKDNSHLMHIYFLCLSFAVLLANTLSHYLQQWSSSMCSCILVGEAHNSLHFWQLNLAAFDLGSNAFLI